MAPSPTGEYHIGSMRTLLYNYALAKKFNGQFVLRIEDTDRERFVEGSTERLMKAIYDYGFSWDEGPDVGGEFGPYVQSERLDIYKKYASQLVESGHAYYCFCSKERLEKLRDEQQKQGVASTKYDKHCVNLTKQEVEENLDQGSSYVIRLNVQPNQHITFNDQVLGDISIPSNDIDDQVLLKSDGFPTYHLAVVVDDHLMHITHILRGVEWLPSTPKHILLYKAFGWDLPIYAHVPLLKEKGENKKLSKRHGSVNAGEFLREGYLPEALVNFLMFLGWNPGTEKEVYTIEEFIHDFSIEKIHKTDLVVFDRDKLAWFNAYYIRNLPLDVLYATLLNWAKKFEISVLGSNDTTFDKKVLSLVQERMRTLSEFNDLVDFFYKTPLIDSELLVKQAGDYQKSKDILNNFYELFMNVPTQDWISTELDRISHEILAKFNYKPKEAFMTLRVALTGITTTPPIFDILEVLGKDESLKRIKKSIEML
jgi:glutamyl-tRNA synthetase